MRPREAIAYLSGVYQSDGYIEKGGRRFGLHVKDRDFVRAFVETSVTAWGKGVRIHTHCEGRYWRAVVYRRRGFGAIRVFEPRTQRQRALWLRGLFDGDGCACASRLRVSRQAVGRSVRIYNTRKSVVIRAKRYLGRLGISSVLWKRQHRGQHYGLKPVWDVRIRSSVENHTLFLNLVGSSITRKLKSLRCVARYQIPTVYRSAGGRAGCASRWGERKLCNRGHPWVAKNWCTTAKGTHRCRICARQFRMESYYRKKGAR